MIRLMVVALAMGLTIGLARAQEPAGKATAPAAKAADKPAPSEAELKTKVSYGIGLDFGKKFKAQGADIDPDQFVKGLKDGLAGTKAALTDEEINEAFKAFSAAMQTKAQATMAAVAGKNKKEGEAFLAANKSKEGVKTLPSGLQYKVLKNGTGKTPKATDTVSAHYAGRLLDGTEFDSSIKRGEPADFPVNGVIPGWIEALQLMKVGSKWQLFIPSEMAYGERGQATIPPNSVLIFDVELLGIQDGEAK
ncbi:FKBP-type peptidyl-prolyl cis-trans isomerase [Isosphaeraceae bacterium EP7]